ncbi:MAG: hypothetical protein D6689_18745, partial [Deltaproteobacteria bacterium]
GAGPDAAPAPDGTPADAGACPEFLVADDGTAVGLFDVVISELSVAGGYLELFNHTDSDVDLSTLTGHRWCVFPTYPLVSADAVTVPAHGFATIPLPAASSLSEAGGELVLYKDSAYASPNSVLDYLCWGTGQKVRKATAEAAGKWSGDCLPAIPAGGAIHRNTGQEGIDATDYTVDATQSPLNCAP